MSPEIIYASLIVLIAAFVQACTGFSFAMISAPLLTFLVPHSQIPALVVMLSLVNNIIALAGSWRGLQLRLVVRLLAGAVVGLPLGVLVLWSVNLQLFQVLLGLLVAFTAVAMLKGWRADWGRGLPGVVGAGFFSGLLSTASSLSGPPVILSMANHDMARDRFRANLLAYFGLLNILTVVTFLLFSMAADHPETKLLTTDTAGFWLKLLPALIGGTLIGMWFVRLVNEDRFKTAVLVLLVLLGASITLTALATGTGQG